MKPFYKTLLLGLLGGMAGLALSQSVPYPFNSVTSGTVTSTGLDAGTAAIQGTLTVGGAATLGAGATVKGVLIADAGQINGLNVGVATAPDIAADSSGNATLNASAGQTVTLAANGAGLFQCNASSGCSSGYIVQLSDLRVGGSSSSIQTNVGLGSCALASGTCNAAVPNASGASLCYCDIQGGNWAEDAGAFTCHARADAGSATVWVQAGVTPIPGTATVGVHCDN